MEQFIALEGPILDLAACHSQGTIEKTVPLPHEPQGFEWIPHGDASARKRARAHVTRGFRRQKAAQAQLLKSGSECGKASKRDSSVGSQESAIATVVKGIRASQPREGSDVDDSAKTLLQGIVLQKTLGPDPFAAFPVRLSPDKQELLDHFFFGLAPLSFVGDNRADFQPVKKLVFNMGLLGAPGFHVILAAAANDIAAARGIRTSEAGLKHQRIAIALVNKKLSEWKPDSSNESLASVALLAGLELLFGTPQNFNTHSMVFPRFIEVPVRSLYAVFAADRPGPVDGLTVMLKLRGGLECLRDKDPQVYSIISWFDYAGSCNLVSRRRFESTEYPDRLHSNPEGVPVKIISSLPAGYDLYQELMCTFDRLHTMTAAIRSADTTDEQRLDISVALDRVDAALYESICILDTEFNRSRRRHLQESICLLTMVYTSLVSEYEGPQTEIFIYRFEKIWTGEGCEWGSIIIGIFRSLLVGEGYHSEVFMHRVLRLVDVSTKIAWAGWRHIKEVLMAFFVWDPACHGQLQDIWKDRMEPISPLKEML